MGACYLCRLCSTGHSMHMGFEHCAALQAGALGLLAGCACASVAGELASRKDVWIWSCGDSFAER